MQLKNPVRFLLFVLLICSAVYAQNLAQPSTQAGTPSGFRALQIDASKVTGEIRSFQGLNGAPLPVIAGLPDLVDQYKALRVDQVRTHDIMGPTDVDAHFDYKDPNLTWLIPEFDQRAQVVKAGNAGVIFPDSNADADKPESYNFGPTDKVIASIRAAGAEVYYRVGRSWGADYTPPQDFDKFANVVKHIAMHYNQGWANGSHDQIRYWEFWNEPEGFWTGTPEQFYSLYEKTARALKSVDPTLKVGGDARAMPFDDGPYREGFLDYCAAHNVPLDFYSWHAYSNSSADPYDGARLAKGIRGIIDAHGFPKAESILSEWNLTPDFTEAAKPELQGIHTAAFMGAAMTYFQDAPLDHAHFYRGDAVWMGLFNLEGEPYKPALAFRAMGMMQDTPQRVALQGTDTFGFAGLAGRSADGKTVQILLSNYAITGHEIRLKSKPTELIKPGGGKDWGVFKGLPVRTDIVYRDNAGYNLVVDHLPWGSAAYTLRRYRISKKQSMEMVEERVGKGGSVKLSNSLAPDTIELIVLQQKQ